MSESLRIATFNLQSGTANQSFPAGGVRFSRAALMATVNKIAELELDVLLLQEVEEKRWRSGSVSQTEVFAKALAMDAYFVPVERMVAGRTLWDLTPWRDSGGFGLSILSRFELSECVKLQLPMRKQILRRAGNRNIGINGWQMKMPKPRICSYAKVGLDSGKTLIFGNMHLSRRFESAQEQLVIAAGGVQKLQSRNPELFSDAAVILGGDFNLSATAVAKSLEESEPLQGFEFLARVPSYPDAKPQRQIDHLLGRGVRGLKSEAFQMPISDHRLVMAEIELA
ncbi:MAG: endonuclease/exonuclease/phosphatase family protein [Arcanobacterium sp.]|nr:endonuclease/exonuclease/phosphatase family protein [Arcanobacterium sp.]